jgi:hypothetical protein
MKTFKDLPDADFLVAKAHTHAIGLHHAYIGFQSVDMLDELCQIILLALSSPDLMVLL